MPANIEIGSEAQSHAVAMERAAKYFAAAAKRGELAISLNEFEARVKAFFEQLHASRFVQFVHLIFG